MSGSREIGVSPRSQFFTQSHFFTYCACAAFNWVLSVTNKSNLVPRAHVPFGQHQDTELWNNQFPETQILGLPASQRMRGLV